MINEQDLNQNSDVEATPLLSQVAGHSSRNDSSDLGLMGMKGGYVLKPILKPKLGKREIEFYESLQEPSDAVSKELALFVPRYFGTTDLSVKNRRAKWLVLSDACLGFAQPCVMDVKIGKRTWDPNASQDKIQKESVKYTASKRELGFCIPGFQVYDAASGELRRYDSNYGKSLDGEGVREALRVFLNGNLSFNRELLLQFLAKLWQILRWFRSQTNYHFFASSILLIYDATKLRESLRNGIHRTEDVNRPTIGRQLSLRVATGPLTPGYENGKTRSPVTSQPPPPNLVQTSFDWRQNFDDVCKTHSLEHNYEKDLKTMKENYGVVLQDLLDDRGMYSSWVNVKMIDFAHVFPANSIDKNYLEGLETLISIFEQFLTEADS